MIKAAGKLFLARNSEIKEKIAFAWLVFIVIAAFAAPFLPFRFSPNSIDANYVYQPPFSGPHILGTDQLGRDVLSNLFYGSYTALWLSIPVMVLTTLLGICAGSIAGFYGNSRIKISTAAVIVITPVFCFFLYYFFYQNQYFFQGSSTLSLQDFFIQTTMYVFFLFLIGIIFYILLKQIAYLRKKIAIPADLLIIKLTELTTSLPRLILLLTFAAFFHPSVYVVLGVILLTNWSVSARLIRAEVLKIREQEFVQAAIVTGIPTFRILLRHVLPNTIAPAIFAFTFGVASLMALEATLSFLGIGIPADVPSWGRLITGARLNLQAWWLIFFTGIFLVFTILSLHILAENQVKKLQKR